MVQLSPFLVFLQACIQSAKEMTVQRYGDRTKVRQITAVSEVSSSTLQPGDATGRWVLGMKEQNNEVEGWFAAVAPYPLCPGSESFQGRVPRMQVDTEGKSELPRIAAPASLEVA